MNTLKCFLFIGLALVFSLAGCGGSSSTTGDGDDDDADGLADGRDGGDGIVDMEPADGEDGVDIADGADGVDAPDGTDAPDAPDGEDAIADGTEIPPDCTAGDYRCNEDGERQICSDDGEWVQNPCPEDTACDGGECLDLICDPGHEECCSTYLLCICNDLGTEVLEHPCGEDFICLVDTCVPVICEPGELRCSGPTAIEQCNEHGTEWLSYGACNADMDEICYEGGCLTLCDQAARADTSRGCVFYGVDMDQADESSADNSQYAIVVANTHDSLTASVTIEDRRGEGGAWRERGSETVDADSLYTFMLSPDQHVENTGLLAGHAYRITSDIPIIAYQFNPITSSGFTADASLLLPRASLGTHYRAAAWTKYPSLAYYSNVVVVGTQDGTTVTVTVPVDTVGETDGIPAISAGGSYETTVNEGDVLQIAGPVASGDMTGAYVEASSRVAVFGGSECADVPQGCDFCMNSAGVETSTCHWCDHIEEQMYPVTAWGRQVIAARAPVRSTGGVEGTYWKVIAAEDDTTVSITFAEGTELRTSAGDSPFSLDAGGILRFELAGTADAPGDAFIDADKPILAVQYIEGQQCTDRGAADGGDPAMILTVPMEQYLNEYIFQVPGTYGDNYLVVIKPETAEVLLDGEAISGTSYSVTDGWEIYRLPIPVAEDNVHHISGTQNFGIIGVGYSPYVSYGYVGGLSLRAINPF
ncbi:MAG: hypothetical protein ABIJ56_08335 [Pseudomonadota bacterium]